MKVLFSGQVPKERSFAGDMEDAMALADEAGRVAVSDGASESFDSRTWASLLVAKFVDDPNLSTSWLADALVSYAEGFEMREMSWSQQAAFDRGSYATLIGIEHGGHEEPVRVWCVGDSLAVLLDGEDLVDSFFYRRAGAFLQRPDLFCTNPRRNRLFTSGYLRIHRRSWSLVGLSSPVILCMTDALGHWALRRHEGGAPVWRELVGVEDAAAFEDLVVHARASGGMRLDDTTLVSVSFGLDENDGIPDI